MINYLNEQMAKLQGQLKTKHSQSEIPIALNHLTKSSLNETDFQALKTKLQAVETELETQKANNKELTIELNRFITNGADEGQQVEFLNMSLIAAQEELKGQSEKLQQLNATLHSTNHKVGVLELNNSHLVSECAFLKDQNEKMKVEKMRITLILDRDLSKEKKKNKKLTKFLSDKDRLHRQYLKQSKIELAHLKVKEYLESAHLYKILLCFRNFVRTA